jgi:murein L,D-transpeptidase YafK
MVAAPRFLLLIFFATAFFNNACHAQLKADLVLVKKSERKLFLMRKGIVYETFHVVFGPRPQGPKLAEGDEHTPEGHYILDYKKPNSPFYRAIHISYPNSDDRARAAKAGVDPGGQIMIHGHPRTDRKIAKAARHFNWTNGCIAVANEDMDIIWEAVDAGTPITIEP